LNCFCTEWKRPALRAFGDDPVAHLARALDR
jgi:hypothetical protein